MKKLLWVSIFFAGVANAQIQSQDFYSFRMGNMFNVNPAYANYSDGVNVYVGGVIQAKGVSFNNKNLTAGVYSKISKNQGLGGTVITDARGAFQTTKAALSYAYSAKFNENAHLTFGLSAGIVNYAMNTSRIEGYDYLDQTDPTLNRNYYNGTQFVAGAGMLFRWKELDISVSAPHFLETNADLNLYLHSLAEYRFKAGSKFEIAPSVAFQQIPILGSVYSGYLKGMYNDMFWLKAGYQSNQTIHAMVGFTVENIGIGYGYRMSNSKFTSIANGIHEVTIAIKIQSKKEKAKSLYNPTLIEVDHRLTKLLTKKITPENKESVISEVKEIKKLMENTEVNNASPEAADEAAEYLKKIESKLIELQNNINEK